MLRNFTGFHTNLIVFPRIIPKDFLGPENSQNPIPKDLTRGDLGRAYLQGGSQEFGGEGRREAPERFRDDFVIFLVLFLFKSYLFEFHLKAIYRER